MITTSTDHTVTLRRPDPETGEVVGVDVKISKGRRERGSKKGQAGVDFDAALDVLWSSGLAVDDDRTEPEASVSESIPEPVDTAAPVQTPEA